jgi:hypothetical protein
VEHHHQLVLPTVLQETPDRHAKAPVEFGDGRLIRGEFGAGLKRAGLAALRRDHDHADSAVERAAWKLARTKPTTAAGASALLTYIATEPAIGLFDLGEMDWHETAFRTVVSSLAKITRRSQRAA